MNDTVGIDVEGHLDLGNASGRGRDVAQVKSAQGLVVFRHFPFPLKYMDRYGRLIVCGSGEYLAFFRGDRGVFVDESGHDAA